MGVSAGILIGKAGKSGLKQKEQIETVQKFRDGVFQVLVATRVGEEGLDIAEVNQVIFYDNVPSSIRFIQRRGRTGRKDTGKLVVLIAKNTIDERYYWIGKRKMLAAKSMGDKMTKVLEKNQGIEPEKTGLDAFL
jgi:Fanconi anemia group M protein